MGAALRGRAHPTLIGFLMDKHDIATVQALTAALHCAYCLTGASPATSWPEAHHRRDERKALEVLDFLAAGGRSLPGAVQ